MSHWPQWLLLILFFIGVVMAAYEHGKPRKPENLFVHLIATAITLIILIFGGFFRGLFN